MKKVFVPIKIAGNNKPKPTETKTVEVLTQGKPSHAIKVPNITVIPRTALPKKSDIKDITHYSQMPPIKGVFAGVNNNIPVIRQDITYVKDEHGKDTNVVEDIINYFFVDGRAMSEYECMVEKEYVENTDTTTTRTRNTVKLISENKVELADISYGDARKLFIHKNFNGTDVDSILKYDRRDRIDNGKTIYEGVLICDKADEALAIKIIKGIQSSIKKSTIIFR